ncbi:MAG: SGNH/GDSL hydrolase family protein [Chryseolinea sp.]
MNKLITLLLLLSTQTMAQKLIIEEKLRFLALGDSYTVGESVPVNARWPVQLIDSLNKLGVDGYEPIIIATTGWRTDHLAHAISKAKLKGEFNLVSLLIGVNNLYQGKTAESYAPEFEALLQTAIKLAGGNKSHVFVLSIPDYGFTPFGKEKQEQISKGIDAFNAVNKSIAERHQIKYYNITDISRRGLTEPELVATDGLHPSDIMYSEWVAHILSDITVAPPKEEEEDEPGDN